MATFLDPIHIDLKPECGICRTALQPGEKCVALVGNKESTAFVQRTEELSFPGPDTVKSGRHYQFCCKPCKPDSKQVEAPAVHSDCLEVFLQRCKLLEAAEDDVLRRLWLVAVWRTPWRNASSFYLSLPQSHEPIYDGSILGRLGLGSLAGLPHETMLMIQEQSAESPLWRLSSAAGLAQLLCRPDEAQERGRDVLLTKLISWERGQAPVLVEEADKAGEKSAPLSPMIRFTIDIDGIRTIERLAERPAAGSGQKTAELVFGLWHERQLSGATMLFRLGQARLRLSSQEARVTGLLVWDTPTPPLLGDGLFDEHFAGAVAQATLLTTANLTGAHGLTSFFRQGVLRAMHVHTAEAPSARQTAERFASSSSSPLTWHYLPLAGGADHIVDLGVRRESRSAFPQNNLALLVRTRLAGDFVVGDSLFDADVDVVLAEASTTAPPSMIVLAHDRSGTVTAVGAYAGSGPERPKRPGVDVRRLFAAIFPCSPYNDDHDIRFEYGSMSKAPLEAVVRVEVFNKPASRYASGAIFTYTNGGQRCLGECRVGDAPSRVYHTLACICFAPTNEDAGEEDECEEVLLEATTDAEHAHAEDGGLVWKCYHLKGALEGIFDHSHFYLNHVDEMFDYGSPPDEGSNVEYASYPSVVE